MGSREQMEAIAKLRELGPQPSHLQLNMERLRLECLALGMTAEQFMQFNRYTLEIAQQSRLPGFHVIKTLFRYFIDLQKQGDPYETAFEKIKMMMEIN